MGRSKLNSQISKRLFICIIGYETISLDIEYETQKQ
jgi:hypothetical protein